MICRCGLDDRFDWICIHRMLTVYYTSANPCRKTLVSGRLAYRLLSAYGPCLFVLLLISIHLQIFLRMLNVHVIELGFFT